MLARIAPLSIAILVLVFVLVAPATSADCPPDPPPPTCDVDGQFLGGRWDISTLSGTYEVSGTEIYDPWDSPTDLDEFNVTGTLTVEMLGGPENNYLDVACDGTVTGQGHEQISGTITKDHVEFACDPPFGGIGPGPSSLNVTFERSYTITGQVTGTGELELELAVDTAEFRVDGNARYHGDCVFSDDPVDIGPVDVSGDAENVRLSGGYDPGSYTFAPTVTPLDPVTWVEDVSHRLQIEATFPNPDVIFHPPDTPQPSGADFFFTYMFLQDALTMTSDVSAQSDARTPVVTALELQEPSYYLPGVDVDTEVVATIDWRASDGTKEVEFTYGGTVETVPGGSDTVTWTFNAGDPATEVEAVAIAGDRESQPYIVATPKVDVPGWAGSASDWSGASGIVYEGWVDWPAALQTTQTLDTISLLTGVWGFEGSLSSTLAMTANSSGATGNDQFELEAGFSLPTMQQSLSMAGPTETTLACDALTMTGEGTVAFPLAKWEHSMNPLQAIPGLSATLCGLGDLMCGLTESVGISAEAKVDLQGTGEFGNTNGEIQWTGGSLGGDIEARIGLNVVPPPLDEVASLRVEGGGTGCMQFQVAPDILLENVGGEVFVSADASVFFLGATSAEHTWPFGGGCSSRSVPAVPLTPRGSGLTVPRGAHLDMALGPNDALAAAWSAIPAGQSRPSGDIVLHLDDGSGWSSAIALTDDAEADSGVDLAYDADGKLLVCHQRNPNLPLPSSISELDAFAAGFEIACSVVAPDGNIVEPLALQTDNDVLDFGPTLARDDANTLHLFWQRSDGTTFVGENGSPASLLHRSWDGAGYSATIEIASGLTGVMGWRAAIRDADSALIAMTVDADGDLTTDADREIELIEQTAGAWGAPTRVTANGAVDDTPVAGYDCDGDPIVLWRRGGELLSLRGDLGATPQTVLGADFEVGPGFARARMACAEGVLHLAWPQATDIHAMTLTGTQWSEPEAINPDDDLDELFDLRAGTAYQPRLATSRTPFTPDLTALESVTTPSESSGNLTSDKIFESDFEVK